MEGKKGQKGEGRGGGIDETYLHSTLNFIVINYNCPHAPVKPVLLLLPAMTEGLGIYIYVCIGSLQQIVWATCELVCCTLVVHS